MERSLLLKRSLRSFAIVGFAFLLALAVAGGLLISRGFGTSGVYPALAATARVAFAFFWPCYIGGACVALFGPAFLPLRRLGRDLGLAFAAVEAVHLSLVARLCMIGATPSLSTFVLFGSAAFFTYLIAVLSIAAVRRVLPGAFTRAVFAVGMNLIAYAFAVDFLRDPMGGSAKHMVEYLPFAALALAGPALRLAALTKYADRVLRHSPYSAG
jgi:hypothetical protein